jgi:type IV pilus assembly protein PilN
VIETNLLPGGASRRPSAARGPAKAGPSLDKLGAHPMVAGLGALAVLLVLVGGFAVWRAGAQVDDLRAEVASEQAEAARLEQTIALMNTLDVRRDSIMQKMAVIREVDSRRYLWPHVMDEVSRAVPPYAWLTRFAAQGGASPAGGEAAPAPGFTMEGHAGSTHVLTRFMKNLEDSPMIGGVTLITSEQVELQGRRVLKYTLEARWEEPDTAFIQTVPILTAQ